MRSKYAQGAFSYCGHSKPFSFTQAFSQNVRLRLLLFCFVVFALLYYILLFLLS